MPHRKALAVRRAKKRLRTSSVVSIYPEQIVKSEPESSQKSSVKTVCSSTADAENEDPEMVQLASDPIDLTQSIVKDKPKEIEIEPCGKLLTIRLIDFMCHKNLSVKFGRRINFINGMNGSGKSAIIAGLQVCFGMSARQTKRGSSMKNLIRHGAKGNARVQVTVSNDSQGAYRRKELGDSLVVEKVISPAGVGTYKILDHSKRVWRKGAAALKEVKAIRDHFALFIDNPVCILDQEASKSFLKGNSRSKYDFFQKATSLEQMEQVITSNKSELITLDGNIERATEETSQRESDVETHKQRVLELQQLDSLNKAKEDIEKRIVWFEYQKEFNEFTETESRVEEAQDQLGRRTARLDKAACELEQLEQQKEVLSKSLTEIQEQQNNFDTDFHSKVEALQKLVDNEKTLKHNLGEATKSLEAQKKAIRSKQRDLKELVQKESSNELTTKKNKLSSSLAENEEKLDALEAEEKEADEKMLEIRQRMDEAKNESKAHSHKLTSLRERQDDLKRKQQHLKETSRDADCRFGRTFPRLRKHINANRSVFSRPPEHIGLDVLLLDHKWWKAVEACIRQSLNTWILFHPADADKFRRICRANNLETPKFLIMSHKTSRYSNLPSLRDFTTVQQLIEVESPNVFNALVDLCKIERTVVLSSREQGESVYETREKLACGYDEEGTKYLLVNGAPTRHMSKIRSSASTYFINTQGDDSVKRQMQEYADKLVLIRNELDSLNASRETNELKQLFRELKQTERGLQRIKKQQDDSHNQIVSLTQELGRVEEPGSHRNRDKERLQIQLQTLESDMEKREIELQTAQTDHTSFIQEHKEHMNELRHEVSQQQEQETLLQENKHEANQKVRQATQRVERLQTKVYKLDARKAQSEKDLQLLERAMTTCKQNVTRLLASARMRCEEQPTFDPKESLESLQRKLSRLGKKIVEEQAKRRKSGVNAAHLLVQVKLALQSAEQRLEAHYNVLERYQSHKQELEQSAAMRQENYERMKTECQTSASLYFNYYLSKRNHSGDILFDDENRKIDFVWHKSAAENDDTGMKKDTRQLSGGEKSYTTLAFLLSVSRRIHCPFRIMDEFDVYMDAGNRNQSIQILLELSRRSQAQFVFITPNDISMIADAPDVRKLRLHPVAKGVTT